MVSVRLEMRKWITYFPVLPVDALWWTMGALTEIDDFVIMKKLHGSFKTPTTEQVLSVEKGQRILPCSNKDFERCSFPEDNPHERTRHDEALRYLAKIIVNSYLREHGL